MYQMSPSSFHSASVVREESSTEVESAKRDEFKLINLRWYWIKVWNRIGVQLAMCYDRQNQLYFILHWDCSKQMLMNSDLKTG